MIHSCTPTCAPLWSLLLESASSRAEQVSLCHKQTPVKSICYRRWHIPFAAHNWGGSSLALRVLGHWTSEVSFGLSFNLATGYAINTEYASNSPPKKAGLSSTALDLRTNDQLLQKPPPSLNAFLERTAKPSTLQFNFTLSAAFNKDKGRRAGHNLDRKGTWQIYLT